MSCWTHINGVITVEPFGRTQHEKLYILDTTIDHLPKVSGSERNMNVYVVQKKGRNSSCTHNEFGELVNGEFSEYQSEYLVIIEGNLRDRFFDDTLKELNNFLNRLAKRVTVYDILVKLTGMDFNYNKKTTIISNAKPYEQMLEGPSWYNGEIAWAEYLMWDRDEDSWYPKKLAEKYFGKGVDHGH